MKPTSKQHTELLRSRPSSCLPCDLEALKVFVEWAEASRVPKTPEVSLLVKRFAFLDASVCVRTIDVDLIGRESIDGLLKWIEASREEHSLPEEAMPALSLFLSYQDEVQAYKSRIRDYWT